MGGRGARLAAALTLSASAWPGIVQASPPALGTREGELMCAGLTSALASGTALTTGGDVVSATLAHGVFLGRLSVIAPDARFRVNESLEAFEKLSPADQEQLMRDCITKLVELGVLKASPDQPKPR
jgi:hypothetical protein